MEERWFYNRLRWANEKDRLAYLFSASQRVLSGSPLAGRRQGAVGQTVAGRR